MMVVMRRWVGASDQPIFQVHEVDCLHPNILGELGSDCWLVVCVSCRLCRIVQKVMLDFV